MFDIGFWEIAVICVIALLVVGPERMPGLIREVARWTKSARHFVMTTRREFESQLSSLELDAKIKNPLSRDFEETLADMDDLMKAAPDRQQPSDQQPSDQQSPNQQSSSRDEQQLT
jgi:sec-independent protein translocase protein TatB